jgi:hypothetical protein
MICCLVLQLNVPFCCKVIGLVTLGRLGTAFFWHFLISLHNKLSFVQASSTFSTVVILINLVCMTIRSDITKNAFHEEDGKTHLHGP